MMKNIVKLTIAFLFASLHFIYAQCGIGNIILKSQGEVDSFSINYPGCHRILGNLEITNSAIENLDGLSVIDTIDRLLDIEYNNNLFNIHGLKNLITVQDFVLTDCPLIEDLTGLQSFQEASNSLYLGNLSLKDLHGLERVKYIRQLLINKNEKLENLKGLDSLKTALTLTISNNKLLKNLEGLRKDLDISQFYLNSNENLESLTNLELKDLYSFELRSNPKLTDLSGLSGLNTVWFLNIIRNDKLENLNNFLNLSSLNIHLRIEENPLLVDISGLKNVNARTLDSVIIVRNMALNNCHIESICSFLKDSNAISRIQSNSIDCIDRVAVEKNCLKTDNVNNKNTEIKIYPQAVSNLINIEGAEINSFAEIISSQGTAIYNFKILSDKEEVNLSNLSNGLYFVRINSKYLTKIVKL